MWNMIAKKGAPTRLHRWCCDIFKERNGHNRYIVTGVRWAESVKRARRGVHEQFARAEKDKIKLNNDNDMKRRLSEMCLTKNSFALNIIIEWSDDDVWEFIHTYKPPYNPLYDKGFKRVGCVGCPMSTKAYDECEAYPAYRDNYIRAIARYLKKREADGKENKYPWDTPENYYLWWREKLPSKSKCDCNYSFFDEDEENDERN